MKRETHHPMSRPEIEFSEIAPIPPEYAIARQATELLQQQGYEAYFVGGAVRDLLIGKTPKDFDLTTNATPEQILATPGFLKSTFTDTAQAYAVARVRLPHSATSQERRDPVEMEIATFRKDVDAHLGRKDTKVELAGQLETDVVRRDFTINALALDPINNQLIDYVGGLEDLRNGVIRFVGDPVQRIAEDPLRILRAVRFRHRFGFTYDPTTNQAMQEAIAAGRLEQIPADRLRNELTTLLTPSSRRQALEDLEQLGALDRLLPELIACRGVEQSPDVHAEGDVWQHKLLFMEKLTGPPDETGKATPPTRRLLWGALLHDIGKPATQQFPAEPGGRITFYHHDAVGAEQVKPVLERLNFPKKNRVAAHDELDDIIWLEANHMRIQRLPEMSAGKQRDLMNHPAFADLLEICRADGLASWAQQPDGSINTDQKTTFAAIEALWRDHQARPPEQQQPSLKRDLGIDGRWLGERFGLPQGKALGGLIKLLEAQHGETPFVDPEQVAKAAEVALQTHEKSVHPELREAPTSIEQSSRLVIAPETVQSVEALTKLLAASGIPIEQWGTVNTQGAATKSIEDLLQEIQEGETVLLREASGRLIRQVSACDIDIFGMHTGQRFRLVEDRQVFKDGRERCRSMPRSIAEKIKPGEDPTEAAARGVAEELSITAPITATPTGIRSEEKFSASYPGLTSQYVFHEFVVELAPEAFVPEGYVEHQEKKDTYFRWDPVMVEPAK